RLLELHLSIRPVCFLHHAPTTSTYPLSLHDALPISRAALRPRRRAPPHARRGRPHVQRDARAHPPDREPVAQEAPVPRGCARARSEEHTSELQSRRDLVCRLLLEKKKEFRSLHGGDA